MLRKCARRDSIYSELIEFEFHFSLTTFTDGMELFIVSAEPFRRGYFVSLSVEMLLLVSSSELSTSPVSRGFSSSLLDSSSSLFSSLFEQERNTSLNMSKKCAKEAARRAHNGIF